MKKETLYVKLLISLLSGGILSAAWDVWWHRAAGRDTFWIPPHILLYSFAFAVIILGLYTWLHTREKIWKLISLFALLIPVTAPFDNFWHSVFGVEDLSRPISLSWSPAHAALSLAALTVAALLLKALVRDRKTKDFELFGCMAMGLILSITLFLLMPFHPTEGFGQVIGFAGAGVLTIVTISFLILAQRIMRGRLDATMTGLFALILSITSYGKEVASGIVLLPHDRMPIWIMVFAFLITGAFLDLTKNRLDTIARPILAGLIWTTILFGFTSRFFAPEFQYGLWDSLVAIISGMLGGLIVGMVFDFIERQEKIK